MENKHSPSVLEMALNLLEANPKLTRRKFLYSAAVLGGAGALAALGCSPKSQETQPSSLKEPLVFNGERIETRRLLDQWRSEVNNRPDKMDEYLPNIANLAIAYFSKEMSDIFPDQKQKYEALKNRVQVEFLSNEAFCNRWREENLVACNAIGIVHIKDDTTITINKDLSMRNKRVEVFFLDLLHEQFHLAATRREYPEGKQTFAIPEPVRYERGLIAASETNGNLVRYGVALEEAIVNHASFKLMERIGINIVGSGSADVDNWVKKYKDEILSLYNDNFVELLGYHQQTQQEEFFRSIARHKFGSGLSKEQEVEEGNRFVINVFLGLG